MLVVERFFLLSIFFNNAHERTPIDLTVSTVVLVMFNRCSNLMMNSKL